VRAETYLDPHSWGYGACPRTELHANRTAVGRTRRALKLVWRIRPGGRMLPRRVGNRHASASWDTSRRVGRRERRPRRLEWHSRPALRDMRAPASGEARGTGPYEHPPVAFVHHPFRPSGRRLASYRSKTILLAEFEPHSSGFRVFRSRDLGDLRVGCR
jgi:hypothetical protein